MAQMGFYFDQTRCTGCYTCSVACKDWHNIDAGPVNWLRIISVETGKYPRPFLAYLATLCYHCADPPCVLACPAKAITKRSDNGIVVVERGKCIGYGECGHLCLNACPWDAPQFGPGENARMQKCDFCMERLEKGQAPVCVAACPMYALDAGPLERLRNEYGETGLAAGFRSSPRFKPAVIFKPKLHHPS